MDGEWQVIITEGEDGWFVVECPALPGCVSQGKTREEALTNITEAIELYLEGLREHNLPLPEREMVTAGGYRSFQNE